jgi:hypothetical protein
VVHAKTKIIDKLIAKKKPLQCWWKKSTENLKDEVKNTNPSRHSQGEPQQGEKT